MAGSSLAASLAVWGSATVPLVAEASISMLSVVMVSLPTAPAVWHSLPLSSEGGEAVVVVVPVPLLIAAVSVGSEFDVRAWLNAWLAAERWLVTWLLVKKVLLLLLLFVWFGGCVVTEVSVAGGGFKVHESWSNSGSWWTSMGSGVPWFNPTDSLATWLLVDGWLTALLTDDCQLLEQRTAGMLQGETKPQPQLTKMNYSQ